MRAASHDIFHARNSSVSLRSSEEKEMFRKSTLITGEEKKKKKETKRGNADESQPRSSRWDGIATAVN